MLFGSYHFVCQLTEDATLPPYKGSTIRGIFGRALKKATCVLKKQECKSCLLRKNCLYAILFDTGNIPPPFVIEPPLVDTTHFKKDDIFDFHLILFGEINKKLPQIISAFKEAESFGFGKAINNGKKGSLRLKEVRKDLYTELKVPVLRENKTHTTQLKINLLTPLRLKFRNKLSVDLPFHVLIRAVLRRIFTLFSYYGEGEPELDYAGLVRKAESVKTVKSDISWFDWRRYSFRQDQAMLMGGIVGSITYEGDIGEFVPLIQLCEKLHAGKQASFGLGKIRTEEKERGKIS